MKSRPPTFYGWVWLILLLAWVCIAAGVSLTGTPVEIGTYAVPFTGLDLTGTPTNLPTGAARECVNFVFDRQSGIRVRNGIDQWNATTYPKPITFLGSYVPESGNTYYLVGSEDTCWLPLSYETDWTYYTIQGWNIDQGIVDCYASDPMLHIGHVDSNHFWRALLGAGVDLKVTIGTRASEYRIVAVLEDTLIKLDSNLFAGADSTYVITLQDFEIHDAATCNGDYFVATNLGLIRYHGDSIAFVDSLDYTSLTLTADYPVYDDYHGRLSWMPVEPGLGKNHVLYVSMNPTLSDTATQADETRHLWYTMQYPVHIVSSSIKTWGAAMRPDSDSTTIAAIYEVETDSSTAIQFLVDSIVAEVFTFGSGENDVILNKFYPADSTWDSTRFETGDWVLRIPSCDTCNAVYRKTEFFSIPGMRWETGTDTAFYACDGPYNTTSTDPVTVEAVRRVKVEQSGASYLCLEVYKDRLFTVRADNPDELRYSVKFTPQDLSTYEVVGLDLSDGNRIQNMYSMLGMLFIFTRNNTMMMTEDPGSEASYIVTVAQGVGMSTGPKGMAQLMDGRVFLPHHTGFYLFDGSEFEKISGKIEPIITDSINWPAAEDKLCAEYYNDNIWISYPSGAVEDNNRTLIYHVPTGKWGNMSVVAGDFHRVRNSADTNQFLIASADTGAVYVYKGNDDNGDGIYAEYRTGWDMFGSQAIKEVLGYYITYDKSASCTLSVDIAPRDTVAWADSLKADATTQTYKDKRRNVTGGKAHGRFLQLGLNMYAVKGESWISRIALEVAEKEEKSYDR